MLAPGDLFDFSVTQQDERVGQRCGFKAVSGHNGRGVLLPCETPEQLKNHVARRGVQVAGGLIGQQETR